MYIFEAGDEDEENTETSLDREITSVSSITTTWTCGELVSTRRTAPSLCVFAIMEITTRRFQRKIHRDTKATNEESSKDRFTLDANEVIPYLRGHHQVKGKKSSQALSEDIHSFLSTNRAYPFIRTVYRRMVTVRDSAGHCCQRSSRVC